MISLPIISIVCCFAYVIFILFKYGVPVSVSETYYILPSKWDWLFAAWSIMTSVPFGIWWFEKAPDGLKWIPIVVVISLLMVGAACCYKSGPKQISGYRADICKGESGKFVERKSFMEFLSELKEKFSRKEFFKYGPARLIHYANSLIAIILTTIYICSTAGIHGVTGIIIPYIIFILIGMKVDGVYNKDYSADVDNKAWIFFMEIICFTNLFIFVW